MAVGVGFFLAYLVAYVVNSISVAFLIGHRPALRNLLHTLALVACGISILWFTTVSTLLMLAVGAAATITMAASSVKRLDTLLDVRAWLRQKMTY